MGTVTGGCWPWNNQFRERRWINLQQQNDRMEVRSKETRERVVVFGSQSLRSPSNSFREPILELMVQKVSCMYWLKIEIALHATSITKLE